MANMLDEMSDPILEDGRDVNVIAKKIPVEKSTSAVVLEVVLWCAGIIPGIIYHICKINAGNYFKQLEQKLQHDASQIDNYLEQRVVILTNAAKLLDKAIDLDKDTFSKVAMYRSGNHTDDAARNEASKACARIGRKAGRITIPPSPLAKSSSFCPTGEPMRPMAACLLFWIPA